MSRPIILGMNNPRSSDPLLVLSPTGDPGSAGNRLWNLSGMTETEYRLAFERRNLVRGPEWTSAVARAAAKKFSCAGGSSVLVLGSATWAAFPFLPRDPMLLRRYDHNQTRFYAVPHPSGRNLWYNDKKNRARVGRLLRRLAR